MRELLTIQVRKTIGTVLFSAYLISANAQANASLRAMLVGVDQYANSESSPETNSSFLLSNLRYASADVLDLAKLLATQGLDEDHVQLFANSNTAHRPSYQQVREALESLSTSSDDTILFVFCGHGINVGSESYLCFPETRIVEDSESGKITIRNALSVSDLSRTMSKLPGKHKVILTDACRNYSSSTSDYSRSRNVTRYDLSEHLGKMAQSGDGREEIIIISSCLPGQVSLEISDERHGLFFSQLLEAFSGRADFQASGNMDGRLSLYEVFQFAASRTREYAEKLGSRQHPFFEGGFTSECDLLAISPDQFQALKQRYQRGDYREDPPGLNEQLFIEKYADAVEALGYGDIQRTIELCSEVLESQPGHREAQRLRSVAFLATGRLLQAYEDATGIGSPMKVRFTGAAPQPELLAKKPLLKDYWLSINEFAPGQVKRIHTLKDGDVLEISTLNGEDANYQRGELMRVSRMRPSGGEDWQNMNGWVVTDALKPASVEGQLDILRDYQLQQNLPVIDAENAERIQRSASRSSGNFGSAASSLSNARGLFESASNTASDINQTVGQVSTLVNGIRSGSPSQIASGLGIETPPAVVRGQQIYGAVRSGSPTSIIQAAGGRVPPAYYRARSIYSDIRSGSVYGAVRSLLSF